MGFFKYFENHLIDFDRFFYCFKASLSPNTVKLLENILFELIKIFSQFSADTSRGVRTKLKRAPKIKLN